MRNLVLLAAIGCGSPHTAATDGSAGDDGATDGVLGSDTGPFDDGMSSCPPGQWCMETSPVAGVALRDVWAVNTGDVFAVGDGGTIIRRRNNTWTAMQSNTTQNLVGVWAANSQDVWAVGAASTIMHFNGTTWSPVSGATTDVNAVWGSSGSDIWMPGAAGEIFHWNGSSIGTTNKTGDLFGVSGTGPNDAWIIGENTRPLRWNGTTWSSVNDPLLGTTNFAVLALATSDVWIAAFVPTHWNGTAWATHAASNAIFADFSGPATGDIWGAGGTHVGHWNGTTWTIEQPAGNTVSLYGVTTAASYVWIVGSSATILHRN